MVATTSQCYVYTTKNWNTPVIFDLRNGAVTLIVQAPGHFLLTDATGVHLYYYEGRFKCTATWPGIRPDMLTSATVSLSPDTIGMINYSSNLTPYVLCVHFHSHSRS